jgi:DNA-binding response OmpR family regulator
VTRPRILLVEDDPTSRAFLAAAAEALPADVDTAANSAEAMALATNGDYALWLLDARLPDGDGPSLLAALRARGLRAAALAHTAARERSTLEALVGAGFDDALVKPIAATDLQAALRHALGLSARRVAEPGAAAATAERPPTWDDGAALSALNGQQAHVDALRQLFVAELPATRDALAAAVRARDRPALQSALHRLRASCGFVGAARLGAAAVALQEAADPSTRVEDVLAAVQDILSPV